MDHPNFPCPFCTKIFDEKAEVVDHLDTCDGTEDFSAVILLSVVRKLRTILTTATSYKLICYLVLNKYSYSICLEIRSKTDVAPRAKFSFGTLGHRQRKKNW
jgi:hypothetical protein